MFNIFVTRIRIIQVPFWGAFTYFLDCTRYFRAIKPRQKAAVAFLGKSHHAIHVTEGKWQGFLALCVQFRFDYSYWPFLRDFEIIPGSNNTLMIFWPLYIDITADRRCGMAHCSFKTCRCFRHRPDHYIRQLRKSR